MICILIVLALAGLAIFVLLRWVDDFDGPISLVLLALVAGISLSVAWGSSHYNDRTITCHVDDKDRGGRDGSYRVYTTDCGTLANKDSWLRGKTNSADVWRDIRSGETQTFHVVGWRFGLLSQFPNILDVRP